MNVVTLHEPLREFVPALSLDEVLPVSELEEGSVHLEAEAHRIALDTHAAATKRVPITDAVVDFENYPYLAQLHAAMDDALAKFLEPRQERSLIRDTYACRKGAGTHAALRRAAGWARSFRYWVRLDVRRYFPSIDHEILRRQWQRYPTEPFLAELCARILDAGECETERAYFPGDDLFTPHLRRVGLPLGNLTSQLWANGYLSPVDHLVKDRLRFRGYLRYMEARDPHGPRFRGAVRGRAIAGRSRQVDDQQ